jgi:hypothetical protein
MATVYTKYLRQTTYTGFTTTNATLTKAQYDSTLIGLKQDIDALVLTVAAIPSHTQETDRYLKRGSDQEYDSYYNFRGSFDGTFGDDATNTVEFLNSDANLFTSVADYEIQIYGLKDDGDGITQRVEVGYKDKGLNGFIAMPTEDCHIVWQVLSNLRAKTGI